MTCKYVAQQKDQSLPYIIPLFFSNQVSSQIFLIWQTIGAGLVSPSIFLYNVVVNDKVEMYPVTHKLDLLFPYPSFTWARKDSLARTLGSGLLSNEKY